MSAAAPDFDALAQPGIRSLRAYDPGHDLVALRAAHAGSLIELGSNESPFGIAPGAMDAITAALPALYRYPDPRGGALKQALAETHGVGPEQIILGNGSHELLMLLGQVFAGPNAGVVASQFGFAVYALAATAANAPLRLAPALPHTAVMARGHDLDAIADVIDVSTRLLYLANPNNPTGTWYSGAGFAALLAKLPANVLVVVDEAYREYVTAPDFVSASQWLARDPRVIVTGTFSKAHALAGLRVGYALAAPGLIAVLERARESFNVNALGLAAAKASLADATHIDQVRVRNAEQRQWLTDALRARGLFVYPSQTNFVLVEFGNDTLRIEDELLKRGIVLRPMAGYGLAECLRISLGTADENMRLVAALDAVMAGEGGR
ncbi:MAG: histidinol-phosphate transaminase [Gammaproteobacteria bacterium HGW-Gammaproteobacteria-2]|nr:MAG: histidinol-phosphate transaminase [Gammaproteobacteria bacterium HGW-Gammaproteobacteria-2]